MIFWKKKLIECCKCKRKYSFDDNLFYHLKEYILICPNCNLMHKVDIQLLRKEYKGLKKINRLDLTAIDIGNPAIDRADSSDMSGYTFVVIGNPANATGTITSVEIWAASAYLLNVEVATFYVVSGNNLSTRATQSIGTVTGGAKRTFTVSLAVQTGDYLGLYCSAGDIECDVSGGVGGWYVAGDKIPCTNQLFSFWNDGELCSLYGTGATLGWPHKWNGVTISKLNGAVISKWNGIA